MLATAHSNETLGVQVTLDERVVEIPPAIRGSLADVCELLERLALQSDRVLTRAIIDGKSFSSLRPLPAARSFQRIEATTLSFHHFTGAGMARIEARLRTMSTSVDKTILLVLINNRAFARAAWQNWMSELRASLIEFNFLEESAGSLQERHRVDAHSIERHIEALHIINALAEVLLADDFYAWEAGQAAAFSTVCEHHFLVWLKRLCQLFAQATEYYAQLDHAK